MIKRTRYIEQILPFVGTELIKVITGVRRSGKSMLLKAMKDEIIAKSDKAVHTIELNFERLEFEKYLDYHVLNDYLEEKISQALPDKTYLFLDEIQEVSSFEKVINSLRATFPEHVDIYITGSNSKLLSSELSTLLSGRYVHFEIYPFVFNEYLTAKRQIRPDLDEQTAFEAFLIEGGMPFLSGQDFLPEQRDSYLNDIYNTIVLKDIIERKQIRDIDLLKRIYSFVLGNAGRLFSTQSVVNFLKSERLSTSVNTVNNYMDAAVESYFLIPVRKYDLQGKRLLKTQEKLYTVDHGLRQAMMGRNLDDIELTLENIVLLELLYRGYEVTLGSYRDYEVDFIAEKQSGGLKDKLYIQVSYLLNASETLARELRPLKLIKDNYPKLLLTLDPLPRGEDEGIRQMNLRDWLLKP